MKRVAEKDAIRLLEESGAVKKGHFIGTAGGHLPVYVSKEVPTRYPGSLRILAEGIAWRARDLRVDVIVAPPQGALCIGIMVAEELGTQYAQLEKIEGVLVVKRGPFKEAIKGARVGICEDIFNSGDTTRETIYVVREAGGNVIFATGILSRGHCTAVNLGVPHFRPLVDQDLPDFTEEECKDHGMCFREEPIVLDYGHGATYRKKNPDYPGRYVTLGS